MAEGHQRGDDSPADHDAGDPEAGSRAVEDEVSRNLEEKVTKKEDAGSGGEDGIGEPGDLAHREFGKAYVDSVDVGEDVAGEQNGDEPEGDLAVYGGGEW